MNTSAKSFHKSFSHGLREKGFFMEQNHSSRPLISVLIPVYNAGKYLAETLASIKNQTYSNLEIICIDDGSMDNSLALLQEFARKDPRFKIISRANKGVANTRNQLLQEAKGKYIAFVDGDDIIEPICIEHLLNWALNKQADVVRVCIGLMKRELIFPVKNDVKNFLK